MKVPISWLKEYVDIDVSIETLQEKLFSVGFEVEEVINYGANLNKVVVVKILQIDKHPNADKLSVTQVDAGKYGKLQIVTNAKNIQVGDLVPLAVDGATLFDGAKINKGALRGVDSDGMFCGGEELGINDDFYEGASLDGVLVFHDNFPLGEEVKDLLGIQDTIFDINVTANRPDCQSIYGIAREVAAVLNKQLKPIPVKYTPSKTFTTKDNVSVQVVATDLCPKYMLQAVNNVKVQQSPAWLKKRLFSMGVRSINNIVDITNYVLFELGQPMHAFDGNLIENNQIIIKRATQGEKFVTLDEKEVTLSAENLMICDGAKSIGLAGIMGGLNSEITNNTTKVYFESAFFKRDNIRKSSKALNKKTDASSRFEKGVDSYTVELALNRAMNLIEELGCGEIANDKQNIQVNEDTNKVLSTKVYKINGVLGIEVPSNEIENILTKLNFGVQLNGDDITITVPRYRTDIDNYPDIAEEIIREYGYNHLTPTLLKNAQVTNGRQTVEQRDTQIIKEQLCACGYNEIISYSFVSEKENDLFKITDYTNKVKILNPLGEDVSVMRTNLFPSMVYTVQRNLNRKNLNGKLFEYAKVYLTDKQQLEELPEERVKLCLACFGENEDFFTLKGTLHSIFDKLLKNANIQFVAVDLPYMHPTRTANIYVNDKCVGFIGQFNPVMAEKLDINQPLYIAEIDIQTLQNEYDNKVLFKVVPKYPAIDRDLALLVDEDIKYQEVYDCIKENGGKYLINIQLFDVYQGDQVEKGKKSMAYSLKFNSSEKTLTVDEIDKQITDILTALDKKLNIKLR